MTEKNITTWTRALRYQPYAQWSESYKTLLAQSIQQSIWKNDYHIQAQTGLLNDPNGFSFFNGKWRLFYQAFPFGAAHGLKSWAQLSSIDLIHWEYEGLALLPDTPYDSHGAYSGSALPIDDKLFLFYTGNVRDDAWQRHSFQLGAWLDSSGEIKKELTPLISENSDFPDHFRDPMIFPYHNGYVTILGAQDKAGQGKILTYFSATGDIHDWQLLDDLKISDSPLGYMVECPNLVFIDDKPVLIFCPQGLPKTVKAYENIFPNMYLVADDFDITHNKLVNPSDFENLDDGFDVYATQAFNAPDGRALAISWIGLPDLSYPSDAEGWANCLSLVKALTMVNGKLFQYPVRETLELRQSQTNITQRITELNTHAYELETNVPADTIAEIKLFADASEERGLVVTINTKNGTIIVNRKNAGLPINSEYGDIRKSSVAPHTDLKLNIFMDASVFEIYLNGGERVITGRIFPSRDQKYLVLDAVANSRLYELKM